MFFFGRYPTSCCRADCLFYQYHLFAVKLVSSRTSQPTTPPLTYLPAGIKTYSLSKCLLTIGHNTTRLFLRVFLVEGDWLRDVITWGFSQSPGSFLGGGFKYLFIFIPTWGNDPFWRAYFSDGLKLNHQLDLDRPFLSEARYLWSLYYRFHRWTFSTLSNESAFGGRRRGWTLVGSYIDAYMVFICGGACFCSKESSGNKWMVVIFEWKVLFSEVEMMIKFRSVFTSISSMCSYQGECLERCLLSTVEIHVEITWSGGTVTRQETGRCCETPPQKSNKRMAFTGILEETPWLVWWNSLIYKELNQQFTLKKSTNIRYQHGNMVVWCYPIQRSESIKLRMLFRRV